MKWGECAHCGRKGIIQWITYPPKRAERKKIKGKDILVCFGAGIYCCNHDHYVKFRKGETPKNLVSWAN